MVDDNTCSEVITKMSGCGSEMETNFIFRVYRHPENVFDKPCDSKLLGIFYLSRSHRPTSEILVWNKNSRKALKYETNNGIVFHALTHLS